MPKLSMVEQGASHGNNFDPKLEWSADMFAGRSSLSPRIDNDERAIDGSSCRGAGAGAQSE